MHVYKILFDHHLKWSLVVLWRTKINYEKKKAISRLKGPNASSKKNWVTHTHTHTAHNQADKLKTKQEDDKSEQKKYKQHHTTQQHRL